MTTVDPYVPLEVYAGTIDSATMAAELERIRDAIQDLIEQLQSITGIEGALQLNGVKVLGSRIGGWGAPTGTATRSGFNTATVTLPQLAERVKALVDDLTTHGMLGA